MEPDAALDELATEVVDVCFHVRKDLGAGLYESIYKALLAHRLRQRGHTVRTEVSIPVVMDGITFPIAGRADVIVNERILLEAKAVRELHPIHAAQTLTYLRFSKLDLALLVTFHALPFCSGVRRFIRRGEVAPATP